MHRPGFLRNRRLWGKGLGAFGQTGIPSITNVSLQPVTLNSGEALNISVTVTNNSNATLQTQGPEPGFIYNEGDDFNSRGFAAQTGKYRVGIDFDGNKGSDHPYRWGIGGPLAPGQSVTVKGTIKLQNPGAKNYWAGLVQEWVSWVQNNQGKTNITVSTAPTSAPSTTTSFIDTSAPITSDSAPITSDSAGSNLLMLGIAGAAAVLGLILILFLRR